MYALNSHGNYIVDSGKSWKNHGIMLFDFCGNPLYTPTRLNFFDGNVKNEIKTIIIIIIIIIIGRALCLFISTLISNQANKQPKSPAKESHTISKRPP